MTEYMDSIPSKIASKVQDKDWSETFVFEEMPCNHDPNSKEYKKVDCEKCNFDNAELSLEEFLNKLDGTEKTQILDIDGVPKNHTLSKIIVQRGRFDDCIGWNMIWTPDP